MKIIREYTATLTMEIRTNSWADYEVEEGEEPDTEELNQLLYENAEVIVPTGEIINWKVRHVKEVKHG